MNFELIPLDASDLARREADALVLLLPEGAAAAGKDALSSFIAQAQASGDLDTRAGKCLQAWRVAGVAARRVLLVGCGDGSAAGIRKAAAAAVTALRDGPVTSVVLALPEAAAAAGVQAAVLAVADASYVYTTTQSKPEPRRLKQVSVAVADVERNRDALKRAVAMVRGMELAKEWANRPGNHATPTHLAKAAQEVTKGVPRMHCEVLGPKEVEKLGMGAFMAVAQGTHEPLRFIVLRYDGAGKSQAPVVLVGKGITFDSGGISIKPAAEMDEMKFDMSGAASVLGVFRALAELKPTLNVVGLIPACENLPDGRAVKPGDVVTSMSGQTIEILNTDAEGRLVLCDALTYAERFKPRAVVDIATLTGACMIALGSVRSGLFSSSDALARALQDAGDAAQDPCWRMPLDDDYAEGLKTRFADVANVAGRAAGAVTAAKFLQRFAGKFDWAHLDIAGTAWKNGAAKGATGRPVPLLLTYLINTAQAEPRAADTTTKAKARQASSTARKRAS